VNEAASNGVREIPIELGRGVRHGVSALNLKRNKWMRGAWGGPAVFVGAKEPDGVGVKAGGLGGASDLDGRVAGLRRVEHLIEGAGEN
jgi:hypothetical protein